MKLVYGNNTIEIRDEVFLLWFEGLEKIDSLLTDEARQDLFNGATLEGIRRAWDEGKREYHLSDDEKELLLTLIQMRFP